MNDSELRRHLAEAQETIRALRATEALQHSEEMLSLMFESIAEGITVYDLGGNIRWVNNAIVQMHGCSSKEELIGQSVFGLIANKDQAQAIENIKSTLDRGYIRDIEYTLLTKHGREFNAELSAAVIKDAAGNPVGFIAITEDITERKSMEQALRVSHRFLELANQHAEMPRLLNGFVSEVKALTGCAAVGIRLLDREGNIPYQAYDGFSRTFYELESPLSIKSDQCLCINVVKGETDPRLPFYTKGGSFYMNATTRFLATVAEEEKGRTRNVCHQFGYESVALIPIRRGDCILGLIHVADPQENRVPLELVEVLESAAMQLGAAIDRVQAVETLRRNEKRFRLLAENAQDLIYRLHIKPFGFEYVNPAAKAITGYTPREYYADPSLGLKIVHPDDRPLIEAIVQSPHQHRETVLLRLIRKDGTIIWTEMQNVPIYDKAGNLVAIEGIARDITERKRAEDLFRTLAQNSPVATYIVQDRKFQYVNHRFQKISGYSENELLGANPLNLVHPEDRDNVRETATLMLKGKLSLPYEYRLINKAGETVWVMESVSSVEHEGRRAALISAMDITAHKQLQSKVVEYEELNKLKSDLLSTVSHELRTPLATIKGYTTMLLDYDRRLRREEKREHLQAVDKATTGLPSW